VLPGVTRLSRRKKLIAASFAGILALVVPAAYSRNPLLLGLILVVLALSLTAGMLRLDQQLKKARTAARTARMANQRLTQAQGRPGAVAWWGKDPNLSGARLVQRLTKLRSVEGRDVLVSKATSGKWSWRDLAAGLEMYRLGGDPRRHVLPVLDAAPPSALLLLADLSFRQNILQTDMLNAATLYQYVFDKLGDAPFKDNRRGEFFLDSLTRTGQGPDMLRLQGLYDSESRNARDLNLYRANATNPFKGETADVGSWLGEINAIYDLAGLVRLELAAGSAPAFLRLTTQPPEPVTTGPLVTIIMPVYRPDEYTDLAIRSALSQSYRNIEVIIVDDGSGTDTADRLPRWSQEDSRVRVVLADQNSGAYTSRNIGYSMANGEYLTIFDGDDWQHPQKIELLVQAAVAQADRRLVSAPWTRADQDLFFHYRGWKGAFITPAHVSVMFHVATIREKLGHWDSVRKAADTEFILRYRALVEDADPVEVSEAPLTLSLVSSTNLSIDDFRLGYRSPDRVSYRDSYEHWHNKIRAGEHNGYLEFPARARAFPAPPRFLAGRHGALELDILFAGDFGEDSGSSRLMFEHLEASAAKGQRIGLMHFPSILHTDAFERSFSPGLMEAFAEGRLARVELTDRVVTRQANIYDPTAFQYGREYRSGIVAERVVLWAGEPPYDPASQNHKYEVGAVERNVLSVFGAAVQWIPMDIVTADAVARSGYGPSAVRDYLDSQEAIHVPDDLDGESSLELTASVAGAPTVGENQ
jgi:glycosyltransferase involved in cell wall biosynthesis